ncbi:MULTISPECIES: amino acid ABC transporter permease [Streptomyces]|uniref:Glutamate ABC transporter permease n=1 Tax=Streptomyces virginiae TaxID=1961 RepID=A0ABQ3NFV5_STRVG|nr:MULTISPECIES: amino acid ABC transporter permease [Streptomyces]GLV93598.1 glutamate ABC transporter permease [Streptomyces lavendulae subsp. lavendulae]KOU13103.1 amino acid ABC transporter permease [Streptomyces sp. WM6349]KOU80909.1 amino acid ABC transporter permease [Streptomyces sp. XY593]KOU91900.1 amino acid ABC transporter permease [Streptomyces sp. XY533]KOV39548.1 amino acid ABC transporter permease [Streptomyces sp. H036]
MSSVLYDTPGPRAKVRNWIYSGIFVVLFGLVLWWALSLMGEKGQLDADKWTPFVTDSQVWTTYLLPGLLETLKAGALAMVIALPLGAALGIGRLSDHAWVRAAVGAWVEFFRAIPVLMLMLFSSALYAPQLMDVPSDTRPFWAVVTGLVLYNSAVIAEIVRAGVLSLPKGQAEAAKAIGLRKGQTMTHVLLPQAVTAMLPALVSQLVVILKDTALGGALLGFAELLSMNRQIAANYSNTIATMFVIALIYIAVNFALTVLASWLEKRLRGSKKSTGTVLGAEEIDDPVPGANTAAGA